MHFESSDAWGVRDTGQFLDLSGLRWLEFLYVCYTIEALQFMAQLNIHLIRGDARTEAQETDPHICDFGVVNFVPR